MASTTLSNPIGLNEAVAADERSPAIGCRFPLPGVVGVADDVARWSAERRFMTAARLAGPKLPASMQKEFMALFSGTNLVIIGVVFAAWAASHAFGVGEAFDLIMLLVGLVMIGPMAWQCAKDLARFVQLAQQARNCRDLDDAGGALARVVAVLGVTVFMALIAKAASRMPKGRLALAESAEALPERSMPPASAQAPARAYEILLPVEKVMDGEGALAQAMRKAALDDWYRNYPQLNKWRKWNPKTKAWETAAAKRASHIAGSDLAATVVRRRLQPGTEITQYQAVGRQLGTYLAFPSTSPGELAILADARIIRRFVITSPFEALETTAARFAKGQIPGVGGKGGGRQLIMPPDWERYVRVIWGERP
jgi:hypothetical protein